ncbi:hypothetical protein BB737_27800, partial [Mycobacterium avium subsp. hominissuis]
AEVAAARGRAEGEAATARAAEARARAEADDAIARMREEIEQVRAETAAQVAAAHEQTEQAVAALRAAQAEAAQAHADAEQARLVDAAGGSQLLSVPVPAAALRGDTDAIEDALAGARDLDYALEVALSGYGQPVDADRVRALAQTVQRQAAELSEQLQALSGRYREGWRVQAAHTYVAAATRAYGGLLARIAAAVAQLAQEPYADAALIAAVTTMLDAHPWRR